MDIIEKLQWRYATKKFDDTKLISEEKLQTLKTAFNLTASSYGLQPVKLTIISNKDLQKDLVTSTMGQEQIAQASHIFVFCIPTNIDTKYINTYFDRVRAVRNTPDAIINPFKTSLIESFGKKSEKDIKLWATKQAYLTLGNMLTVCALEGIDACPMEGFYPDAYDKKLNLKTKNLQSVLLMPVGYRAEDDMFADLKKVRKPIEESIFEMN